MLCPNSKNAILRSCGAGLAAVDDLMKNNERVFCAIRPPGHHAETVKAMGFCFVNNAAVAARYLQQKYKVNKIVYTASSSCYGLAKKIPTSENDKIDIQHPYALTKYLGEQILLFWSKIYKIEVISLRLFNIYGLRSRTTGAYGAVFGTFLRQKISTKPLTVVGDGKQKRDFLHIDDLVRLFIKCSKIRKTGVYLSLIHISEPTRLLSISYAVFCL